MNYARCWGVLRGPMITRSPEDDSGGGGGGAGDAPAAGDEGGGASGDGDGDAGAGDGDDGEGGGEGDGEGGDAGAEAGAEGSAAGGDGEGAGGEGEEAKPKRVPWHKKRIDQLTARNRELEAQINGQGDGGGGAAAAGGEGDGGGAAGERPTDAQGRPLYTEDELEQRAQARARITRLQEKGDAMYDEGVKLFPKTFKAQVNAAGEAFGRDLAKRTDLFDALTKLPNGAAVYHKITADIDEMAEVLDLAPIDLGMRLAEISAQVGKPQGRQVSKAPAPIETLDRNSGGGEDVPLEKKSMADFVKEREKQREARYTARGR